MTFLHQDFSFEVPDEWLADAGMGGFIPSHKACHVDPSSVPNRTPTRIAISDVEPVRRQLSHGVFNNDSETGLSARDRVIKILSGFRAGAAIPPVEVVELPAGSNYRYRLTHGAHRFYCSVAAGFSEVPAVNGFDLGAR